MGNRLSKIYTRTGDDGNTGMADGRRLSKADIRFEVMGDIDELNAHIGMIQSLLPQSPSHTAEKSHAIFNLDKTQKQLHILQHLLFNIGGELAMPEYQGIDTIHVQWLENSIDTMNQHLPALKDFILPAGSQLVSQIHIARTVCRRAERHAVLLCTDDDNALSSSTRQFINRLSDWLFVFARICTRLPTTTNHDSSLYQSDTEVLWDKNILSQSFDSNT
ncbi:cob(I)yrinic acid a,c-diamide adenosyltransferase [Psychrobacter sp. I-STPA6b]|uniref:cob(I)yrinic acid a,c-diamide adenosyltransferase n=1 Tax=Psychrobacter sp. I-STPA6b TaxID=2585718 RepID=UPI001D0CB272|nr:cob(I)yrinic acid a,c-diamide adenosyltransferase [Psychrobacter sp. I-STPA6b]